MISSVGVLLSSTTALAVSFPTDVELRGIGCVGAATVRVAVSRDPNVTASALITPTSSGIDENLIAVIGGGQLSEISPIGIPQGSKIYFAASAATSAVIFLQS